MLTLLTISIFLVSATSTRNEVVVFSDSHLNSEYIDEYNQNQLKNFLLGLTNVSTSVQTLIIAGDILEMWLYPVFDDIPSATELLLQTVVNGTLLKDLLRAILDNQIDIIVLNGNHDRRIRQSDFADAGLEDIQWFQEEYRSENWVIQHANQYDLFDFEDKITKLSPWSVAYTRFDYSDHTLKDDIDAVMGTFPKNPYIHSFASEVVNLALFIGSANATMDILGRDDFYTCLDKAIEVYETGEYPEFLTQPMKDGCFYDACGDDRDTQAFRFVEKQLPIFERYWKQKTNEDLSICLTQLSSGGPCMEMFEEMLFMIFGGLRNSGFEYFMQRLVGDAELVIMGHTHQKTRLLNYIHDRDGHLVYVNDGSFVTSMRTFAKIHLDGVGKAVSVDVCEYSNEETCLIIESADIGAYNQSGKESVPVGWTCDEELYHDTKVCDCGCGIRDPDCNETLIGSVLPTNCYHLSPNSDFLETECHASTLECQYKKLPVPEDWTCSEEKWMNSDRVCYCNCSAWDPTCMSAFVISGCDFDDETQIPLCMRNETDHMNCLAVPKNKEFSGVPDGWTCPKRYYNTMDGCDCNCGISDPDCAKVGATQCNCDFAEKKRIFNDFGYDSRGVLSLFLPLVMYVL